MSLSKQLWIGIAILMVLAFVGSFWVSSMTVKRGVEDHLRIKNIDNANSLALAATQLAKDQTLVKLLISAQFDNGHYQYIKWLSPEGDVIVDLKKSDSGIGGDAPEWFKAWVNIEAPPGTALIQSGWNQLGTIELQSAPAFAYQALWQNTVRLLLYFGVAIPVCGLIGHLLMLWVIRPLGQVVAQARELRKRRYTKVALPATREFRELVESMNSLSDEVKRFFESEASKLHKMQQENEVDPVSGTYSREYFLKAFNSTLVDASKPADGTVSIFRVHDLQSLNRTEGRNVVDSLLKQLGDILNHTCSAQQHWIVGRLNGSDFAVLSPGSESASATCGDIHKVLMGKLEELGFTESVQLYGAATSYHSGGGLSAILSRVDKSLAIAEARETSSIEISGGSDVSFAQPADYWRELLNNLLKQKQVPTELHSVIAKDGSLLHKRVAISLKDQGVVTHQLQAWAARFGKAAEFDALGLRSLVPVLDKGDTLALELSPQSLQSGAPFDALLNALADINPFQLQLNIPEYLAAQDFKHFREICKALQARSFTLGLVNAGQNIENIGELYNCGISYIVLDSSITLGIDESESNKIVARSLATMFHSIGVQVYAEGVQSDEEWELLMRLGLDGASGDFVDALR